MGNCNSCLPQTPNHTELENPESRANPLPPFTAPHPVDISTVPAPGASSSYAFAAGPSNTEGEDLDETPSMVAADYGGIILEEGQQPNFHMFKEKDL
ncbi:hypothetical protein PRUPE_7G169000 [Prunus persica]|uniref:Uncharacterized protein n=1 Tax=Prunus persica TaxID=3760 RepID=A0A251NCM4_PRUPE|nr:hypothetical protein PRUPE_7G169000 [Prunus persica]